MPTTRPSLVRSLPFWVLTAGSLASAGYGGKLLLDTLGTMTTTLTDGTATGVDVYVGQSVATLGAVLLGAGVVGLLLALTVMTAATLRPAARVEIVEPVDAADDADELEDEKPAADHGYERGLGYTSQIDTVDAEDAEREASVAAR